jgi:hypothetical protein
MVSSAIRIMAGNAALLPAGVGFLMLTDGWQRFGRWSRFGVGLLAGQASFMVFAPLLLYAGLSLSPIIVLPIASAVLAVGLRADRRRERSTTAIPPSREAPNVIAVAIMVVPLTLLAVGSLAKPLYQVDAILNWVMKAKVIWGGGHHLTGALDERLFARPDLHPQSHLEYPLGMNSLLAWSFHWMGSADIRVMHLQLVLVVAAGVATAWAILRPLVPDLPLAIGLAGLTLMPVVVHQLLTAYADVPLALLWATGALALIRWADSGGTHLLSLATLLLAASLATKQDGAFYDVAIYIGVAALLLLCRTGFLQLVLSAAIVILTAVPWQLYAAANDLERSDVRPGFARMQAQTDRLLPTLQGMLEVFLHPRTTLVAVPLVVTLAIVCIARGRYKEALPFLIASSMVLVEILVIYWNSAVSLDAVLIPALGRVLMGLLVLSWLLVPVLAFAAVASPDGFRAIRDARTPK